MKVIALGAFVLSSCAQSQKLSNADRQAIRTVYVSRHVRVAREPATEARTDRMLAGLGAVGQIAMIADESQEVTFKRHLSAQQVKLDEMMVKAFSDTLSQRQLFKVVPSEKQADAVVYLEIPAYGYSPNANVFSNKYYAVMACKATMARGDRTVWLKSDVVNPARGELTKFSIKELYAPSGILRARMQEATNEVTKRVVNDLAPKK